MHLAPLQRQAPPRIEAITFDELMDKEFPPVPWYVDELLPRSSKVLLAAYAKAGKTFILLDFAKALTCTGNVFDYPLAKASERVRVLMIDQEIGAREMQKRATKVFVSKPRDLYKGQAVLVSKQPALRLDTPQGASLVLQLCKEHRPNVLLLDPMTRLHRSDENNSQAMAAVFANIDEIMYECADQEMSVVLAHHVGKAPREKKGWDPLDSENARGSGDWIGWPDGVIMVHRRRQEGKCGPPLADGRRPGWYCHMRFTSRHNCELPDIRVTVNEFDDGHVRFQRVLEEPPEEGEVAPTAPVVVPFDPNVAALPGLFRLK